MRMTEWKGKGCEKMLSQGLKVGLTFVGRIECADIIRKIQIVDVVKDA